MQLLVSGATTTMWRMRGRATLGHLITPANGNRWEPMLATGLPIAADNGCFGGLDEPAFVRMLQQLRRLRIVSYWKWPLWVAVPDKVADARETLVMWRWYRHYVRGSDLPAAFVAQDGCEEYRIPWHQFECLFIGGSTAWKEGIEAARLIQKAKRLGKWVHVGRVNTQRRERYFQALEVDSIDGTKYSRFGEVYIPQAAERLEYRQIGFDQVFV